MKTEAQLRREAAKQGYALQKSRSVYSLDNLGGYRILDLATKFVVAGSHYEMSQDNVEKFLLDGSK